MESPPAKATSPKHFGFCAINPHRPKRHFPHSYVILSWMLAIFLKIHGPETLDGLANIFALNERISAHLLLKNSSEFQEI